jgi:hypothetical protein
VATTVGNLIIKMGMDLAQVRRDMDQARSTVSNAAGAMGTAMKTLGTTIAGAFSVGAVIAFGKQMMEAAGEAEKSINRLNAVMRATGGAANVSARDIEGFVGALVASTQFDDESIRNAAAELLIFRNVQGDTFRETLKLSADVAAFFGTNMPEAARKLGRAMEDPEAGFSLLRRSGVVLNQTQQDLIKEMTKVGDVAGAQRFLLAELEKAFSGVAKEMNTGVLEATSSLSKAWDDMLEAMGRTGPISRLVNGTMLGIASVMSSVTSAIESASKLPATVGRQLPRDGAGGNLGDMSGVRDALAGAGLTGGPRITLVGPEEMAKRAAAAAKKAADEREKAAKAAAQKALAERERYLKEMESLRARSEEQWLQAIWDAKEDEDTRIRNSVLNAQRERQRYLDEMAQLDAKSTEDYYLAITKKMEEDDDAVRKAIFSKIKELEKVSDAAQRFGLTFASAFENALQPGANLRDLIKSIESDLMRMGTRLLVTEPVMGFFAKQFDAAKAGGGGAGDMFSSLASSVVGAVTGLFSGPKAKGGFIPPGTWGFVGEQGPEVAYGGRTGKTIVPVSQGQTIVNFHVRANDASSFNRSRGQMMSDLSREIDSVRRRGMA